MIAPLVAAAVLSMAAQPAPQTFSVVPARSTLAYHLVHRFHDVNGVSRAVEGKARILPDGTVQVMVRAPLASFDSGEPNRDANMREVTGAARNPFVVFKGVGHLAAPVSYPAEVRVPLRGELTFKTPGPLEVEVAIRFDSSDRAEVRTDFAVSLDAHHVERPSLLLVKVNDRVDVTANLALERDP